VSSRQVFGSVVIIHLWMSEYCAEMSLQREIELEIEEEEN
jgi:hypothetical protein